MYFIDQMNIPKIKQFERSNQLLITPDEKFQAQFVDISIDDIVSQNYQLRLKHQIRKSKNENQTRLLQHHFTLLNELFKDQNPDKHLLMSSDEENVTECDNVEITVDKDLIDF